MTLVRLSDDEAVYDDGRTGNRLFVRWCLHRELQIEFPLSIQSRTPRGNIRRLEPTGDTWKRAAAAMRCDIRIACIGVRAMALRCGLEEIVQ
jgi:hypothetical protein